VLRRLIKAIPAEFELILRKKFMLHQMAASAYLALENRRLQVWRRSLALNQYGASLNPWCHDTRERRFLALLGVLCPMR
jgi:hypothetical protein